ncbi:MAG: hypothetical protein JXD19_06680 [Deltaproteobacteria bacterium]|nr:hypothetical protein [Deltaproteobacteria bacterium]
MRKWSLGLVKRLHSGIPLHQMATSGFDNGAPSRIVPVPFFFYHDFAPLRIRTILSRRITYFRLPSICPSPDSGKAPSHAASNNVVVLSKLFIILPLSSNTAGIVDNQGTREAMPAFFLTLTSNAAEKK